MNNNYNIIITENYVIYTVEVVNNVNEITITEGQSIYGKGDKGDSAYQVALNEGYIGTEEEWLISLKGEKGNKGEKGDSATILSESRFLGQAFAIWTGVGLIYDVIYTDYYIEGTLYLGDTEQITLDAADATNPRQDAIAVNASGAFFITGDAEPNPKAPTLDPTTQLFITNVLINAGATTPANQEIVDIYKENVEWTGTSNIATINFTDTGAAIQGTYGISTGKIVRYDYIRFMNPTSYQPGDWDLITFRMKLLDAFANNVKFNVSLRNAADRISTFATIKNNSYGYSNVGFGNWLYIVIPLSDLTILTTYSGIEIEVLYGTNNSGFELDNIQLSKGSAIASPYQKAFTTIVTDGGIVNATQDDDTFSIKGAGGMNVSSVGKVITITPPPIPDGVTKTSDLDNDGADGLHPFITLEDLPVIDISGKEDSSNKGIANGYAPLNASIKLASTYLDIVNDLTTGGTTELLSAEQGKVLKGMIDSINAILDSDDIDLDTLQEIVDAIKDVNTYLSTILINDLTTGGTTKALTAEMGKTLKALIDAIPIADVTDSVILVKTASDIVNQVLDSTKLYQIDGTITIGTGESIIVPAGGLTIQGLGFNVSSLFSNVASHTMFTSPVGGSGDLILLDMAISTIGTGAKVFDIFDVDGTHAIEIEYVNFNGCKSIGKQKGYRQGTMTTVGFYGCADGLQLSGTWNGYKISNSNCFGFGATGTLFKKDTDTSFTNRFFLQANIDFPTGAKLCDFQASNFTLIELFQINSTIAKVNGVININNALALVPNITANDSKSLWVGNIGLPNSADEIYVENLAVTTTYTIDWYKDTYYLELTGNTTFSEINLPASGKNSQEITIYLHPKGFNATLLPNWLLHAVGTLKNNEVNECKLKFIKTGLYFLTINNSLSVYPAPDLSSISPVSITPSTTAELILNGSFFTPATIVSIEGQTVNSITFVNSGQLILSLTTGATESEFDITISNGTSITFVDKLIVNLGYVFIPAIADWVSITGLIDVESGGVSTHTYNSAGSATWNKEFDYTKNFRIDFKSKRTPLGSFQTSAAGGCSIILKKVSDSSTIMTFYPYSVINGSYWRYGYRKDGDNYWWYGQEVDPNKENKALLILESALISIRWISGVLYIYINNVLKTTTAITLTENLKLTAVVKLIDFHSIKYIELS